MNRLLNKIAIVALIATTFLTNCTEPIITRQVTKFTRDWRFLLIDSTMTEDGVESEDFDDSQWRQLNLPHDWAIEGDFSENNPSGTGGGALPGGLGWYRKTFNVTEADLGKKMFITFDGVYMNSTVYINGQKLGHRPYGYATFQYELTPYLHKGKNVIAVRVDNTEQPNSRWYSGCGIYRNVWLTKTNDIYVDKWGTFVSTPLVNELKADVKAQITINNTRSHNSDIKVVSTIYDAKGHKITSAYSNLTASAENTTLVEHLLKVPQPHFWNIDDPYRYKLVSQIYDGRTIIDEYSTIFGIRTFYFDDEQGFILNNNNIKINGVCMHHDLGCLGAAINVRAIERQLQILKEMGCNGIRCSHNPPAPELLQLCDSMGFIVMDEAFDMWRKKKTAHDYARYFNEWHERDLTDLILRDRNHPSVFIWSIGNEVLEQWTHADADTLDLAAANLLLNMKHDDSDLAYNDDELSVNSLLCKKLCDIVHELDPTRPVTAGNNEPSPSNHLFQAGTLDIIGFNYHDSYFEGVPHNFPHKPFIVTESVSALSTRGYYRMPSGRNYIWPERWDKPFYDQSFSCSSYDNCYVPWGNSQEGSWKIIKRNKFISGQYIWTGFDYLGEPTPFGWPARSSYFGLIDLAGFPKDSYYLYQSEWTTKPMLHILPHWNWKDGEDIDVWCYYNQADEVELYLNGESMGIQRKDTTTLHATWQLSFKRGDLRAVSRKDGKIVKEQYIRTAGRPAQIRMTVDRERIKADGEDLSFITVEVLDKDGILCPNADNDIQFEIEGTGFIAGVDNGSPISLERFKDNHRKAFYGKCLVVVQSNNEIGNIRITATSEGLKSAEAAIHCLPIDKY